MIAFFLCELYIEYFGRSEVQRFAEKGDQQSKILIAQTVNFSFLGAKENDWHIAKRYI